MNRLILSAVTDPTIRFPMSVPTLDFLQDNVLEVTAALTLPVYAPNQSTLFPLAFGTGLRRSGNVISSGYFFGGAFLPEVFYCEGADVTSYVNPPVMVPDFQWNTTGMSYPITTIADPVLFTDNISRDVHLIRRYKIDDVPTGSITNSYAYSSLLFNGYSSTTISTSGAYTGTTTAMVNNSTGRVELKGILSVLGSGSIGTLPEGYRPTASKRIPVTLIDDGDYIAGTLDISTAGVLTFTANPAGSTILGLYLDGLSFYIGW